MPQDRNPYVGNTRRNIRKQKFPFIASPHGTRKPGPPAQKRLRRFLPIWAPILLMLAFPLFPAWSAETETTQDRAGLLSEQMEASLENALASHRSELEDLKARLEKLESLKGVIEMEIEAVDSQNTAQGQLLLVSEMLAVDIENEIKKNRMASASLTKRVEMVQERFDTTTIMLQKAVDRIDLAEKQIAEIRKAPFPDAKKQALIKATRELLRLLQEKKQFGERYVKICEDLLVRMKSALAEKEDLGKKLATRLANLENNSLFKRFDLHRQLRWGTLTGELRLIWERMAALSSKATWASLGDQIKLGGFSRWAVSLTALALFIMLQGRLGKRLRREMEHLADGTSKYSRLALYLLQRSMPYLALTVFFGLYRTLQFSLLNVAMERVLFSIFTLMLVTCWGLDFFSQGIREPLSRQAAYGVRHMKRFILFCRYAGVFVILFFWVSGEGGLLSWLLRFLVSGTALIWITVFWVRMKAVVGQGGDDGRSLPFAPQITFYKWWSFVVAGGYLLCGIAGYTNLARYWIVAWSLTIVLLFWGWISLNAIREKQRDHLARRSARDQAHPDTSADLLRWSWIQLMRLFWIVAMVAGLVWAWDRSGILYSGLGLLFRETIAIGSLTFSIQGFFLAIFIFYLTFMLVRIGRTLLNEKILEKKKLERGFKDSILTVSSYVGWGFGVLLALAVIGVNATSLAVVFGALSVGIGFGLQNIFNNFISGLILLFERPIQVGDIVEVNGIWAEVRKINVRATVVQTFDNASVIIPNSDFISQQVTNWSFRDKRMRRNVDVGVAYGSDIGLVRDTLLDTITDFREVLKYPKPDVIFMDHGASALIFRLRFWTHIDSYWSVPSMIRFEIDRRFRELDIEIAFPQQDLHIRSIPGEMMVSTTAGMPESGRDGRNEQELDPDSAQKKPE